MISDFFSRIAEGYVDPRRSMARLLAPGYGIEIGFQIVVLAYLIQAILGFFVTGERTAAGPLLIGHAFALGFQMLLYAIMALAVQGAARFFGGKGTLQDVFLVLAWHFLVTSLLSPVILLSLSTTGSVSGIPAGAVALLLFVTAVSLWLLAAYLAEAHGFQSTGSVFAVVIAVPVVIGLIAAIMLPGA